MENTESDRLLTYKNGLEELILNCIIKDSKLENFKKIPYDSYGIRILGLTSQQYTPSLRDDKEKTFGPNSILRPIARKIVPLIKPQKTSSCILNAASISDLLKKIESQRNPLEFKEALLGCIQLYFDGLVDRREEIENPEVWTEQLEALSAILTGVGITVVAFYRQNREIPFNEVREVVMPYNSTLIRHGSKSKPKGRHLAGCELLVGNYATSVANALTGEEFDLVIPIASGGFEPAVLTANYLGVNQFFPVRYSTVSRKDTEVLFPAYVTPDYLTQKISGRRILLIDDIVCHGRTASKLLRWIEKYNPASVHFAFVQGQGERLNALGLHRHQSSIHLYKHEREMVLSG